jgi:intracellular sulfur oxidation DsrE/DsrF family protein
MKTVFHINSGDTSKKSELLGNIQNLMDDETVEVEKIAVVINSNAIDMVEEGSEASEFIEEFLSKEVEFNACSNSLENLGIGEDEVIERVEVVSSGVGRLNELQDKGFNYIKI